MGNRLSENPSQAFTLLDIPENKKFVAHIHPGPEEIGKIYKPNLGIVSNPINFIESLKNTIENLSNTDFFKKENNCEIYIKTIWNGEIKIYFHLTLEWT